jgi:hypothetical protein
MINFALGLDLTTILKDKYKHAFFV